MGQSIFFSKSSLYVLILFLIVLLTGSVIGQSLHADDNEYWLRVEVGSLLKSKELELVYPFFLEVGDTRFELPLEDNFKVSIIGGKLMGIETGGMGYGGISSLFVSSPTGRVKVKGGALEGEYPGYLEIYPQGDFLQVINKVSLEDYTAAVLGQEMPLAWPEEALKAQAVLIRTFALHNSGNHKEFDFCSSTHCQVYKGFSSSPDQWKEISAAMEIAQATKGLVLSREGQTVPVFYHSACGGTLSLPQDIWGETQECTDHFKEGNCSLAGEILCRQSPNFEWQREMDFDQWQYFCSTFTGREISFGAEDFEYTPTGRIKAVTALGKRYSFLDFWSAVTDELGWGYWPSNMFTLNFDSEKVVFTGRGLGHGVGMCQWGAKALAEQGYDFAAILSFYFPGAQLLNWKDSR